MIVRGHDAHAHGDSNAQNAFNSFSVSNNCCSSPQEEYFSLADIDSMADSCLLTLSTLSCRRQCCRAPCLCH